MRRKRGRQADADAGLIQTARIKSQHSRIGAALQGMASAADQHAFKFGFQPAVQIVPRQGRLAA